LLISVNLISCLFAGGLIDYGHHDNNAYRALTETVSMEEAVTKATELTKESRCRSEVLPSNPGYELLARSYTELHNVF
jgi:hypothetical protein